MDVTLTPLEHHSNDPVAQGVFISVANRQAAAVTYTTYLVG